MKVRMSQLLQMKRSLIVRVFLLLSFVVALCYFICLILGSMGIFQTLFQKIGVALGSRALSFALWKLGLPGGALLMAFLVRVIITEGGVIFSMESGNGAYSGANSGWTSILGQGDGSASSVNQPTPTNSTQTGSAGGNVIPVELQQKREELQQLVYDQFQHFFHRGLQSWQINTSAEWMELAHVCVRDIIHSLEIEDSVSEYERWKTHLRTNPTTLYPLFQDYKTKK